ncbi:MAG: AAA family ATPase [Bacteroidota bacterium]
MKRVMILGCCGSGKSTFAKKIHQINALPLIHLDAHYWKPNWVESTEEEWQAKVNELAAGEQWIMDGNYSGTWHLRIPRADTLIFLDKPTSVCLYRVIKRIFQHRGKVRSDMREGCYERWDWDFLHYVMVFRWTRRRRLLRQLDAVKKDKQVFIFKTDKEMNDFLAHLA